MKKTEAIKKRYFFLLIPILSKSPSKNPIYTLVCFTLKRSDLGQNQASFLVIDLFE